MSTKTRIIYCGFYDFPLAFVVSHKEMQFLFLREFDDVLDDYPDTYNVFALPNIPDDVIENSWGHIEKLATSVLGEVTIKEIEFDPTHRKEIDSQVLDRLSSMK